MNSNTSIELELLCKTMFTEYPDLLSAKQLREILGTSKPLIYTILNSGKIRATKAGRTWIIPKIYLIEYFVESCKRCANNETDTHSD